MSSNFYNPVRFGLGSVFDFFGSNLRSMSIEQNEIRRDGFQRDLENLERDWMIVGDDMHKAVAKFEIKYSIDSDL